MSFTSTKISTGDDGPKARIMDKKKPSATASSASGKQDEKKDENFLSKTAHSIRDKVQGLTDDVKEKAHNLTHSGDSKKSKKDKDSKKTDTKSKPSSKPAAAAAAKKGSSSDSDDEDDSPKPPTSASASSAAKRDTASGGSKLTASKSNPSSSAAPASTTEKKEASSSGTSKPQSTKPSASGSTSKPADDQKNITSAAQSSSSKVPSESSAAKSVDAPTNKPKDTVVETYKPSIEGANVDKVHISFEGVSTVDDLLDRIDDSIENAKIVFKGSINKTDRDAKNVARAPVPSVADLDKKPVQRASKDERKVENKEQDNGEGPIRIDYNDIHKVDDLILKIADQPGGRRVVLVNAPGNSAVVTVQKQTKPSTTTAPSTTTTADDSDDSSAPPKSILKTSQNPSSLDTSTKTSSFEDDQIHVNIEGIQNIDELLDRVDDAAQNAPVILEANSLGEKKQAPRAPNSTDNNSSNQTATQTSALNKKREAPKSPPSTIDQTNKDKSSEKSSDRDSHSPVSKTPGDKLVDAGDIKQVVSSSRSTEKKKDQEPSDWI